ncbi:MAG TPA: TetR/AcrR family transcriptional regulator [Clostridia bacterium]|nr:TetR/AcrR family transcriptional regulator [Clostridia bacterium]
MDYQKCKDEIAQHALRVFVERGYHRTTLQDVAAKCGIGRTTLYSYFKNKEDIFLHVVKKQVEAFRCEYRKVLEDQELSYLEKIKRLVAHMVRDYEDNHDLVIFTELWLLLKMKREQPERSLRQWLKEIRLMFADLFKEAIRHREIKRGDHEVLSSILFGLLETMLLEKAWNKEMRLDAHLRAVYLMLDGLKA